MANKNGRTPDERWKGKEVWQDTTEFEVNPDLAQLDRPDVARFGAEIGKNLSAS